MKRTATFLCVALAAVWVLVAQPHGEPAAAQEPAAPNVLIIVTDDQREGLQVMSAVRNLFRINGRSYPNAYVTTPQCCPSRSSILTGRYTHNHGVVNNTSSKRLDTTTILPYYLHSAGYRTAIFGKFLNRWGLDAPPSFDRWATFLGGRDRYYNATYNVNGTRGHLHGYSTNVLRKKASVFLRRSDALVDDQPWMLYVTPVAAHSPYQPAVKYKYVDVPRWKRNPALRENRTLGGRADKPEYIRRSTRSPATIVRRRQLLTLMSVDDMVQQIYQTIDRLGEGNTIAFFLSDNGLLWGEHGWVDKSVPYSESVRVPFLARWPGRLPAASVDDRMVANIDITPTVLDAAGITPEGASFDGRSLIDESWSRDRMLLEFFGPERETIVPPWASLRTSDYQYVEYYDGAGEVTFREYYDLAQDRWQLENLLGDGDASNDPSVTELHDRLAADRACAGSSCP